MLTGRPAFAADSEAGVIASILSAEPAPIPSLQPSVPPALARAVHRCLAKDPDSRWQSAADLAEELSWLAGKADDVSGDPARAMAGREVRGARRRTPWPRPVVTHVQVIFNWLDELRAKVPRR